MMPSTHSILVPYVQKKEAINVWDSYKSGKPLQLVHRINSVAISVTPPYKYGLPDGYNVNLYKCDSDKRFRKLSGFSARVVCCNFRNDGKLVIVGEEGGTLRICTTDKNKFHLRKMKAHQGSISTASFFYDGLRAASLGSDASVRIWDVTLGSPLGRYAVCNGSEVARGMVTGRVDNNLLCFGDLNGNVAIYDVREPKPVQKITFPSAVSALALSKTDKILAVAAGSVVQSWDFSAQKFHDYGTSQSLHLHYKVITGLFIEQHPITDEEVLLSVSLDKLVKFTSLLDGKELYQLQCSSPLTAIGVTVVYFFVNCSFVPFHSCSGPSIFIEVTGIARVL
ncbi:snoRNA-binding rRNA-processing protein [Schistosoma haematobium]|uniref:SnoRNA-binding rRNA-processing protein n=1 Tax=Schistosoma haematobium TaxID=6185 RepID=A0A922LW41_SCHHA|nr:snoRNA-binding rRNA-processing protein [Schistosoma haematobium]KAH9595002.1 snoRNA-binding rRNA-processing protein [Schistosoma haematobium]